MIKICSKEHTYKDALTCEYAESPKKRLDSTYTRTGKKHTALAEQLALCMFEEEQHNLVSEFWSQTKVLGVGCFSDLAAVLRLLYQNSQATLPHASWNLHEFRALSSGYTS